MLSPPTFRENLKIFAKLHGDWRASRRLVRNTCTRAHHTVNDDITKHCAIEATSATRIWPQSPKRQRLARSRLISTLHSPCAALALTRLSLSLALSLFAARGCPAARAPRNGHPVFPAMETDFWLPGGQGTFLRLLQTAGLVTLRPACLHYTLGYNRDALG